MKIGNPSSVNGRTLPLPLVSAIGSSLGLTLEVCLGDSLVGRCEKRSSISFVEEGDVFVADVLCLVFSLIFVVLVMLFVFVMTVVSALFTLLVTLLVGLPAGLPASLLVCLLVPSEPIDSLTNHKKGHYNKDLFTDPYKSSFSALGFQPYELWLESQQYRYY